MYSYGPPHMAVQKQDDQHEHTFSSYVRIRDVVLKTYLPRAMNDREEWRERVREICATSAMMMMMMMMTSVFTLTFFPVQISGDANLVFFSVLIFFISSTFLLFCVNIGVVILGSMALWAYSILCFQFLLGVLFVHFFHELTHRVYLVSQDQRANFF